MPKAFKDRIYSIKKRIKTCEARRFSIRPGEKHSKMKYFHLKPAQVLPDTWPLKVLLTGPCGMSGGMCYCISVV